MQENNFSELQIAINKILNNFIMFFFIKYEENE